ncbi:ABC transporter ATP-binding protein [Mycetocola reblochoni]|uniref:Methionine ABC transporter ATP-binding protein n=2 Tax=Mycetocola reblochoni TaxID=331618 RepID=A0A1R4JXQ8_9MICO|nr:ABC transporter ATP-binding protein [Mycetocola reblochoni]RLP70603.1 ABC transporter ATP-binding protein [Mycetocola reblochoni]SJN36684.1 Methionine ABC transporter ATP-binding protein [Mycetocola reblochoni REB411]
MYTLTDLTKTYTGKRQARVTALDSVSITIPDGEFVSIQGPTGGGKSTLLQLLGALDRPTSGSLSLGGTDIATLKERELGRLRADDIGFVFQGFNLIPTLTAQENVETALVPQHVAADERRQRAREALESVGLGERTDHLPSELSGGQQQRVAIARALVKRPTVLLADEPTGNLDEHTRDEIMALLESQWKDRGLTMILVTHDSAVARRAQRRLRLAGGHVQDITAA